MVAIKQALEPEVVEEARKSMLAGKPSSKLDEGCTDEKIAKIVGVRKDTLRKAE
jgi:hypothetical protein